MITARSTKRSRTLAALHGQLVGHMARMGLIAFMADPAGDAGGGAAGGTLVGGDASAAPAADAAAATAAAQAAAPAADAGKPDGQPAGDAKPGDKPAADAKPGDKADDKPAGAPEKYEDFKLPDTLKADPAFLGKFSEWAKGKNLSQEAAQEAVNMAAELQQQNIADFQAAVESQSQQWAKDTQADKEFGGDKFKENLSVALRARDQFATPELKTLLDTSKLGNHPEVVRFFYRVGQAISQDGFVPGRAGNSRPAHEEVLYPSSARH